MAERADTAVASPPVRIAPRVATATVIGMLITVNVAVHQQPDALWFRPVVAVVMLAFARWAGFTWSQLGLGWHRLRSGTRWGLGAIGAVAVVYAVGILLPFTRTAFLDARYHLSVPATLVSAFVVIPLGTVLVEEIAFRSVLWAVLMRHGTTRLVMLVSSALFGLWHVLPSLNLASANEAVGAAVGGAGTTATVVAVTATVAFTTAGGLVIGELRRRSGSVLASVGMHWATNGLGVLFGLFAWRLAA